MITIHRTSRNMEIFRKLLNSVAKKYDCGVQFHYDSGSLSFHGDKTCAHEIIRETLVMVGAG